MAETQLEGLIKTTHGAGLEAAAQRKRVAGRRERGTDLWAQHDGVHVVCRSPDPCSVEPKDAWRTFRSPFKFLSFWVFQCPVRSAALWGVCWGQPLPETLVTSP